MDGRRAGLCHQAHGGAFQTRRRSRGKEMWREGGAGRADVGWAEDGKTEVCFDVEGISVVYSEAFHQLLRLSASFLPLFSPASS